MRTNTRIPAIDGSEAAFVAPLIDELAEAITELSEAPSRPASELGRWRSRHGGTEFAALSP